MRGDPLVVAGTLPSAPFIEMLSGVMLQPLLPARPRTCTTAGHKKFS